VDWDTKGTDMPVFNFLPDSKSAKSITHWHLNDSFFDQEMNHPDMFITFPQGKK
jgi:hypothetical protein